MASDATMTIHSSMHEEDDDIENEEVDHHQPQRQMSRLSICTSNSKDDIDVDGGDDTIMHMSGLSIDDGSDIEADGEFSDEKEGKDESVGFEDFDKETRFFSLPATPQGRTRTIRGAKYESDNEKRGPRVGPTKGKGLRERWLERAWEMRRCRAMDEKMESGDSECVVIARAKKGGKCLSMDMGEVKACRDLGFDLQHDWTVEIPCRLSGSAIDTDNGSNSPIANWRISSPGDDPKDVKARLKVWAQAVALALASRLSG